MQHFGVLREMKDVDITERLYNQSILYIFLTKKKNTGEIFDYFLHINITNYFQLCTATLSSLWEMLSV